MKEFYTRELVEAGKVTVEHVSSSNNLADLLTKPHNFVVFCRLLTLVKFGPIAAPNDFHSTPDSGSDGMVPNESLSGKTNQ